MKKAEEIALLIFIFGLLSFSGFAQTEKSDEINPCFQDKEEKQNLIKEAEENRFNVRRFEVLGSIWKHHNFQKRMLLQEGDIFTKTLLFESIKNVSKFRKIKPLSLENVILKLNRTHEIIDILFCVEPKKKLKSSS